MKNLKFLWLAALLLAPLPIRAQNAPKKPLNVAFLIYPNVEALDLSGPLDVFTKANFVDKGAYHLYTVAAQNQTVPIDGGYLKLTATYNLQNAPRPDWIIVPGSSENQVRMVGKNPQVAAWLRKNATASQKIMSVCTGAFVLGEAGLLDGKNSTSHWLSVENLQREFPKTRVFEGAKYIEDGNIVTCGGITSGIDGALFLVEKYSGKLAAQRVAQVLQYRPNTAIYPAKARQRVVLKTAKTPVKLAMPIDPICHMRVTSTTAHMATYQGKTYGFCSEMCKEEFQKHPAQYVKN